MYVNDEEKSKQNWIACILYRKFSDGKHDGILCYTLRAVE
jgi:hypothetical protein